MNVRIFCVIIKIFVIYYLILIANIYSEIYALLNIDFQIRILMQKYLIEYNIMYPISVTSFCPIILR